MNIRAIDPHADARACVAYAAKRRAASAPRPEPPARLRRLHPNTAALLAYLQTVAIPVSPAEIAAHFHIAIGTAYDRVRQLADAHPVTRTRVGQTVRYSVTP